MACTSCGGNKPSSRYAERPNEEEAREVTPSTAHNHDATTQQSTMEYMNTLSYRTLLSMRQDAYDNEMAAFFGAAENMSEDFKALQVHILVQVINGDEYSPNGQTPIYCAKLLKKVLASDIFSSAISAHFPNLATQLEAYLGRANLLLL